MNEPPFESTLSTDDLWLLGEGREWRLWRKLGARRLRHHGVDGTVFTVWAPNARRVSVVGDFCDWDTDAAPMRPLGDSGVHEAFVPELDAGALYKYAVVGADGTVRLHADPLARACEPHPGHASIVCDETTYAWTDDDWLERRTTTAPLAAPISIYEVHLGSWARVPEEDDRVLSYRELAPRLVEHCTRLGFTHVQLMPVMAHPFAGSWGYQVTGYFAPNPLHGSPDDLRYLVDHCHRAGLGVILDWVPAHFPRDAFALARFDGTPLYEHADPRRGEHPDWGTLVFNHGRHEVANFLIASALYWLEEYHVDGLRVDAVSSMLYLDYSRAEGEWTPNRHGGNEDLDAIEFLRTFNRVVHARVPGVVTIAEESTAWPGVTAGADEGGLGFTFKWNMGWMHDTLAYLGERPEHRGWHHDRLTFAMQYEHSEHFINPLSHDEVVHGKGSLYARVHGGHADRLATLRALLTYQFTRPGKVLLFMGSELAPDAEWDHDRSLDWHLLTHDESRRRFHDFLGELGALYRAAPALWRRDEEADGFEWLACDDRDNRVIAYQRRDGDEHRLVVLNFAEVTHHDYRVGVPSPTPYAVVLSTDAPRFGGDGEAEPRPLVPEPTAIHGREQSLVLTLPRLSALVLAPGSAPRETP